MTGQVADNIEYKAERLAIYGSQGRGLFTPQDFDIVPKPLSTACHRGYICNYAINGEHLTLKELELYIGTNAKALIGSGNAPELNGHSPEFNSKEHCANYSNLDMPISFSGSLVCGGDHLRNLFHPNLRFLPMVYFCKTVFEFEFSNGQETKVTDHSDKFKQLREVSGGSEYCKKRTMPHEEIESNIKSIFLGSYRLAVFGL